MDVKKAISTCTSNPKEIYRLEPHLFESVVAELLAGFGWEVSLTPPQRDGGYDILGVTTDPSGLQTSWLIECKRYKSEKKVGVEIARQIFGVKSHLGIPNAVLVTSSSFTAGVKELSAARQDIHLVDFQGLVNWLKNYSAPTDTTFAEEKSFLSCFISHSSVDESFAQKLTARLRGKGIHVWFAPEDILPGDKIYDQVRKAIFTFDKLLVVLSKNSMKSNWVQTELASAIERERKEKTRVLFPVAIEDINVIKEWECFDPDSGIDIARELRSYYIPDFSNWKNDNKFNEQLEKVVKALADDPIRRSPEQQDIFLLQQRMRASYPSDRQKAARELGKLGKRAASAVPTLRKALSDPSLQVRNASAWALGEVGTIDALQALSEYEKQ